VSFCRGELGRQHTGPPEIRGRLWLDGLPPGWLTPAEVGSCQLGSSVKFSFEDNELAGPVAQDDPKAEPRCETRLDITFDIPADVDDETAQTRNREFYDALNEQIEAAPEVIESARRGCETLDEVARARKIAAAQQKVLRIAAKLKGIGLCAEVVDEDVPVAQLRR
jgi:hypothetical protein